MLYAFLTLAVIIYAQPSHGTVISLSRHLYLYKCLILFCMESLGQVLDRVCTHLSV